MEKIWTKQNRKKLVLEWGTKETKHEAEKFSKAWLTFPLLDRGRPILNLVIFFVLNTLKTCSCRNR